MLGAISTVLDECFNIKDGVLGVDILEEAVYQSHNLFALNFFQVCRC